MSQPAWTHHFRTINGFPMHYVTAGSGPALVLVHGWPQSWYEWRHLIPALAEKFTVIAPDLRGLGDSGKPLTGYDKRSLAVDVHTLVRGLGFDKIGLAGHDWGGAVCYHLAYDFPGFVERLLIFDMVPGLFRKGQPLELERATRLWHVFWHGAQPDLAEQMVRKDPESYIRFFLTSPWYNYSPAVFSEEDIREYVRVFSLPGTIRAGFQYYANALRLDAENLANCTEKLPMPVRVWGGQAGMGNLVPVWQAVADSVTGGMVPECGHFIPEEKPAFALKELLDFFAPLSP